MSSTIPPSASERLEQFAIGDFGPEQQQFEVFDGFIFREGRGDSCGNVFLGHQIDLEMQFLQFGGGRGADGGNLYLLRRCHACRQRLLKK